MQVLSMVEERPGRHLWEGTGIHPSEPPEVKEIKWSISKKFRGS